MALDTAIFARMRKQIVDAVREDLEGTGVVSDGYIPKDTHTALDSRAITTDGDVCTLSYGSDADANPKTGQASNTYIVALHEDTQQSHAPGTGAMFLKRAVDERRGGMLGRIAARAKM